MDKTKQTKLSKNQQMDITVTYEQSTPENARVIVRLFAEMLRMYIEKHINKEKKEANPQK